MGTLWLGGARWVWGLHTLQGLRASARGKVPGVGRDFFFSSKKKKKNPEAPLYPFLRKKCAKCASLAVHTSTLVTTPPVGAGGPQVTTPPTRIGLVETTWQTDSVRAALRRACPGALQLDLCDASCLEASLGRLSSLLDTSLAEHGGHVAAT